MGHGRFATQGAINAENAHPFTEGHITLVHNGTISNFKSLQGTEYGQYEVDSQLVARLIADKGAEEIIPKVFGAYVFIWYDHKERTLNLVRNHSRPLFIGLKQHSDTLFWSSERETLEWNAKRNKTPLKEIYEMPTGEIHTYHAGDLVPTIVKLETPNYYSRQASWDEDYYTVPSTKTNVVPFNTRRDDKPKSIVRKMNNKDVLKSQITGDERVIILGNKYTFEIEDLKESGHGNHLLGTSHLYPAIEFVAPTNDLTEEAIFAADYAEGVVSFIQPALPTDKFFDYRVILKDIKVYVQGEEEEDDTEKRLQIMSVEGILEAVSEFRYNEMLDKDCAWCNLPHSKKTKHTKLLLAPTNDLVCTDCAEGLLNTYQEEALAHATEEDKKRTVH